MSVIYPKGQSTKHWASEQIGGGLHSQVSQPNSSVTYPKGQLNIIHPKAGQICKALVDVGYKDTIAKRTRANANLKQVILLLFEKLI